MTNPGSTLKSRDMLCQQSLSSQNKGPSSQSFSCSHVWMWELDYKESWAPMNWCFSTVVLEKTLESPLDSKVIKSVSTKINQTWIFIGRTDAVVETPILWPPDVKNWLIGKDPDARKDWRQEKKGTTEDEMVWLYHCLDEHEFEQAPGVGDGQEPGVLQPMESQRVGHNWATELKWCLKEAIFGAVYFTFKKWSL